MALSIPIASSAADNNYQGSYDNFKITQSYSSGHYKDVKSSDWFYKNVKSTYETGLMVGTDSRHFSPKGNVTWAQAVALLARIHSIYKGDGHVFNAGSSAWYVPYVDYSISEGIFSTQQVYGTLNDPLSRAAFVELLERALPESAYPEKNHIGKYDIPDVSVNTAYYDEVMNFYKSGILSGSDEYGFFDPYSLVSRAECAAIVTRIADPSLRNSFTLKPNTKRDGVYYADDGSWVTLKYTYNPEYSDPEWQEPDWSEVYMYPEFYPSYFNREWAKNIDWYIPCYSLYMNDQYVGDYSYWDDDFEGTKEDGSHAYAPIPDKTTYDQSYTWTSFNVDDHGHLSYYRNNWSAGDNDEYYFNKPGK